MIHAPASARLGRPAFGRAFASLAALCLAAAIALLAGGPSSGIALLAVAAGIVLLVMLVRPELALIAFTAGLYLNLPAILPRFYGVPGIVAAGIVALPLIPLGVLFIRREGARLNPVLIPILVYFVALVSSAVLSLRPDQSMESIGIFLSEGLLIFILVTNVVRTPDAVRHLIWTLVAVGALLGGLSLLQAVTNTFGSDYGGFAQLDAAARPPDVLGDDPDRLQRLAGPIGETNRYGQIMLMLVPLALSRVHAERSRLLRLAALLASVLVLAGVLLTFSRGAAVALGLLVVAMLLWRFIRIWQVVLVGAALALLVSSVAPTYAARVESLRGVQALIAGGPTDAADGAILGRATSNIAALNVFVDHPLIGVGPGRYAAEYSMQYANELGLRHFEGSRRAHSLYLEIAAETGILGLGAFLVAIGMTGFQLVRERRWWRSRNAEYAEMATAFALSLLAYLASGIFLHLSYQRYLWLILALGAAVAWTLRAERARYPDRDGMGES